MTYNVFGGTLNPTVLLPYCLMTLIELICEDRNLTMAMLVLSCTVLYFVSCLPGHCAYML